MRADKRTRTGVTKEVYSDFDSTFRTNPITGTLLRVVDENSVKQSIRNLVLTTKGEWPHHPEIGSRVYHMLFEPIDASTAADIKTAISFSLRREPRAQVLQIDVRPNMSRDGYDLRIVFNTINSTRPIEFTDFLKRVR